MKPGPTEVKVKIPRAVLVALISQKQSVEKTAEYLDELAFLAETSGIENYLKPTLKEIMAKKLLPITKCWKDLAM